MDKQTMKLGLLAGAAVLGLAATNVQAASTPVCTGATTASSASVSTNSLFVTQGFTMNCSANVVLAYEESSTQIGVCAASNKGDIAYGGTTAGGSVASVSSWASAASITGKSTGC